MTSVTVVVPMTIRRRGGRKQIIGPDGAPVQAGGDATGVAETRGDPALVKALVRAFRWRRMLEEGRYCSIRELAAAEGVDRAYVGRVLNLTLLAPKVVEAIMDGRVAAEMTLPAAMAGVEVACVNQQRTLNHAWTSAHSTRERSAPTTPVARGPVAPRLPSLRTRGRRKAS